MALRNPRLSSHVNGKFKKFVKKTDAEPLSENLWNQTEGIRQETLRTYFVQGIGNGDLNPTDFGEFMVQDSVYCQKAKASIDIAAEKAFPGPLKEYLSKESQSYEKYYKTLFKKWHIEDASGITLDDACKSYAAYENNVAVTEDTIYMIVAMIPCMKLWPWLGQQLESGKKGVYDEWYNDNFDPTYDGYKELDKFVDDAAITGSIDAQKALKVYAYCMSGELAFFGSVQHK
ncbi:uncharacterized protein LOC117334425 [Pecten maximus]|uniref:uncharacterized protein LOC117334425 n=1 Tax=Pecten maximus TaxID=6579 RepID=UPI001457F835|nr:uncharacterized protein LOC117334425 [Pecten maximus]XP_033749939.1 uncharacterized protein LOC117334425 [Pecten maximus]